MDRKVNLKIGDLALDALGGGPVRHIEQLRHRVASAVRYYLSDKSAGRPEWRFPTFLPEASDAKLRRFEVEIDGELWHSLEEEARRQEVSIDQLAQHAILYYVADREAGRLPGRIRAA